jgi:hypothetical protein
MNEIVSRRGKPQNALVGRFLLSVLSSWLSRKYIHYSTQYSVSVPTFRVTIVFLLMGIFWLSRSKKDSLFLVRAYFVAIGVK